MKKLLSTVLALAMLLSLVVVPVSADSYEGSGALADKTAAFTVETDNKILYDNGGEQYVQFHIYVESTDGATPIRALSFKLNPSEGLELATERQADNQDFWYEFPEAAALIREQTDTDSTAFYSKFEYTPSSRYFAAAGSKEGTGITTKIEVMTICGKVTGVGDYTLNLTEVVAGEGDGQQFRREATGATVTVKAQPATNLLPMTVDKGTVTVGEEFTVTLSHKEMTVSSFTASMNFKTDLLKVVDIETGAGYRALSDNAYLGTCVVSTVDEANNTGSIGIGAAASGDNTYAAAELLKVTFRALQAGETAIELEENSDGANGYIGDAQSLRFTVNPAAVTGVTVSGTITSFGDANEAVAVTLVPETGDTLTAEVISGTYKFKDVPAGTYTLKVEKKGHAPWTETVTVDNTDITRDVTIYLWGDVNGNGKVDVADMQRLYNHLNGTSPLEHVRLGDVNGNGKVDVADMQRLYNHLNGTVPLE